MNRNKWEEMLEETHKDLKILYTLWLDTLTIEAYDKRTGKTHTRVFAGFDDNVIRWFDELQEGV